MIEVFDMAENRSKASWQGHVRAGRTFQQGTDVQSTIITRLGGDAFKSVTAELRMLAGVATWQPVQGRAVKQLMTTRDGNAELVDHHALALYVLCRAKRVPVGATAASVIPELKDHRYSDRTPLQLAALAGWAGGTTPPATIVAALVRMADEDAGRQLISDKMQSDQEALQTNFTSTSSPQGKPFAPAPKAAASKVQKGAATSKAASAPPPIAPKVISKVAAAKATPDMPWSKMPFVRIRQNPPEMMFPEVVEAMCSILTEAKYAPVKVYPEVLKLTGAAKIPEVDMSRWDESDGMTKAFAFLASVGCLRNDDGAVKARALLKISEGELAPLKCHDLMKERLFSEAEGDDDADDADQGGDADDDEDVSASAHTTT